MSSGSELYDPDDPESPVYGAGRFIGREGLVRNLADRLVHRQSILLYGGPKLGKTSLLLHLKWLLEQQRFSSSHQGLAALYLDLHQEEARERLLTVDLDQPLVLLLDNCDELLGPPSSFGEQSVHQMLEHRRNGPLIQAIIWAGGRAWRESIRSGESSLKLVSVPLAILLKGEARSLVKPDLTPDQLSTVLSYGGTHPYVLKMLRAQMLADGPDTNLARTLQAIQTKLRPFFQTCLEAVREPIERTLLGYLVRHAQPINPREAARALGLPTVKPAADKLCYLGLISRWNLNEGAMLHAGCRLFNDWYLLHADEQKSLRADR